MMSSAVLRLESFATGSRHLPIPPSFTSDDLDQAFADGLAQGLARKDDDELRGLRAGIEALQEGLTDNDARRHQLRHEAVRALTPILTAILDSLAPTETSRQLEQALIAELARMAEAAGPLHATIACNSRARAMVERCLAESGAASIQIAESDSDLISLSLQGGRIEFSTATAVAEIRRLIQEINEEEAIWTRCDI